MAKTEVFPVHNSEGVFLRHEAWIMCPACKGHHAFAVRNSRFENGASWSFNEDLDKPTFSPSMLVRYEFTPESGKQTIVCHSFVTNGMIQFLGDCTHELTNQTVELPDIKMRD